MTTLCLCNKHLSQNLNNQAALAEAAGRSSNAEVLTTAAERIASYDALQLNGLSDTSKGLILHALDEFIKNGSHIPEGCTHFPEGVARPTEEESLFLYKILGKVELVTMGDFAKSFDESYDEVYPDPSAETEPTNPTPQAVDEALGAVAADSKQHFQDSILGAVLDKFTGGLTPANLETKVANFREFLVRSATITPNRNGTLDERAAFLVATIAPITLADVDKEVKAFKESLERILAKRTTKVAA